MLVKDLFIDIPERANAPKTRLHIRMVSENEDSLNTMPYVFMLPGGPGANHSHYKDYECLHSTGNIVFFDPRGCGLSEKGEPSSYTMDNYIQDVDVIRKQLNLEKIALLGKSYGAMCALGYTLTYPEHVSSLVLAAGSPSFKNIDSARLNIEKRGSLAQQQVCEQLWAGNFKSDEDVDKFFDVMDTMYSWRKRHNLPVNRPAADHPFAREPLNQGFGGFLRTFNYEDRLHEVACNTLILVGEEDWVTDKKHSEFMASKIPNNQFIVFANADHSMESDVPEEFFSSISVFLKSQCEKRNQHHFFQEGKNTVKEQSGVNTDAAKDCSFN
ncbi:MAG: alpha/beta hydrolase [Legionella sp.]|uniref:alpha/beta fold hydrolase n=1 Tax=Legionella sp. TaxID=459 RepID=UPI00283CA5E1|nr:alpha/beta hydrolase [Legionella sp.]